MLKSLERLTFAAFTTALVLTAQAASAATLFTNWTTGVAGGNLWTAGGPCSIASCYAIEDNFSNQEDWVVTGFTFYIVSAPFVIENPSWRYALFSVAGDQVVAPTNTALTITDLGPYDAYVIYKAEITGLSVPLPAGEYWFRFTNTEYQAVYPAYGVSPSAQTLSPGFRQLTGSPTVEALLSTDVSQRSENWAFEVSGTTFPIFSDGFDVQ
jgi:hypothetical protein